MAEIKILCLGGLEATRDGQPLDGFESRKVRALLAYLVSRPHKRHSREQLASLLWSDRDDEAARRNLRQAVYNLNQVLGSDDAQRVVEADSQHVYLSPSFEVFIDRASFETAVGDVRQTVQDHGRLAEAVSLYRGDFLAGFGTSKAEEFDDWMESESRRLRELYIEALRGLIESYVDRGEMRLGIPYARRLVEADPLSEEAHRYLMRLYASTGRRGRALRQYRELESRLRDELDVEPSPDTQALAHQVLAASDSGIEDGKGDPVGPILPLVGRDSALAELRLELDRVRQGESRLTLIHGEPGLGKSRLVKSFLHSATQRSDTCVLLGRCDREVLRAFDPFPQILAGLLESQDFESQGDSNPLTSIDTADLADLVRLRADLRALRPSVQVPSESAPCSPAAAVGRVIERLLADDRAVVLFVDQLHDAPDESLELLGFLHQQFRRDRLWILATTSRSNLDLPTTLAGRFQWLSLDGLQAGHVAQAVESLVPRDAESEALRSFLARRVRGLPLRLVELLNTLWARRLLRWQDEGSWCLDPRFDDRTWDLESLDDLVRDRVGRLPTSVRRLATLAAVLGHRFDRKVLEVAAGEHPGVVEIGLELLLENWVIRQADDAWAGGRRESDLVLWGQGNRRRFEFAHEAIRVSLYQSIQKPRRRVLHGEAAEAMMQVYGEEAVHHVDDVAWHLRRAGRDQEAIPQLLAAMRRARRLDAKGTLTLLRRQVRDAMSRVDGVGPETLAEWHSEFARFDPGTGGISPAVLVSLRG